MKIFNDYNRFVFLPMLLCIFLCTWSNATVHSSWGTFGRLIILDEGRQKPIETYARIKLLQYSGKQKLHDKSAIDWLAGLVFNPQSTFNDKIFLINNPDILNAMGIEPIKRRRYSFNDLRKGHQTLIQLSQNALAKEQKDRTPFEKEVLRVQANIADFMNIAAVFNFMEPHADFTIADSQCARYIGFDEYPVISTYIDILTRDSLISKAMNHVAAKDHGQWNSFDTTIIKLSHAIYQWSLQSNNASFCIIPFPKSNTGLWQSPKEYIVEMQSAACTSSVIKNLVEAKKAVQKNDEHAFSVAMTRFSNDLNNKSGSNIVLKDPTTELTYNHINPFSHAKVVYGIALLLSLFLILYPQRWLARITSLSLFAGFALHTYGFIARMLILGRPPITNLYETFLFVAWAGVVLGLVVELINRKGVGFFLAAICGFGFLHAGTRFGFEGDSMGMLAVVLNNNFWLASHIITIILGYAGCSCAGIVGHVYCIQRIALHSDHERLRSTSRILIGLLAFGMAFTVVGTVIGGMWAEQAWGRFWGWDPKENGALLIILWNAILFHAREGNIIRDLGMAIGSVIGLVLIMLAWIGVNLLGIGFHSYGFVSGGTRALTVFIAFEVVFVVIISLMILFCKKLSKQQKHGFVKNAF